jgi:hypothetical protein
MSSNNRILYSCQAAAIGAQGFVPTTGNMIHGLQSIGITTNFNLEQVFELGQIEIYENIEGTPDVEVTLEKVLDGYPLMYLMASTGVTNTNASGLLARSKEQCDLRLGIFSEAANNVAEAQDNSGNAEAEVYCSGMYISSVSYSFPVDGNCTESVTLVGNNKKWLRDTSTTIENADVNPFNGTDSPKSLAAGSGGVQRREDIRMDYSILPVGIDGTNSDGAGNAYRPVSAGQSLTASGLGVHVQSVSISTDFSREDVFELGKKTPYYRPATFPVEVSCEVEAITTSGDFIQGLEDGDPTLFGTSASGNNTQEEKIFFALRGGMTFDLGQKNRLSSVSYGGGDATGGNVSCTYSYTNFNDLAVKQLGHDSTGVMGFGDTAIDLFEGQNVV